MHRPFGAHRPGLREALSPSEADRAWRLMCMESGNLLAQPQSCHGIGPGGGGGWNVRGPSGYTEKFFWWIELLPASQQHDRGSVFGRVPLQAWRKVRLGAGKTGGLCHSQVRKEEGQDELRALPMSCGRVDATERLRGCIAQSLVTD